MVAVVVAVAAAMVISFLRGKKYPPITMIRTDSPEPFQVDIAWEDEEEDQIYTVFWSNSPGIKIQRPETYRRSQSVAGKRLRIYAPYKFVHFVIAKINHKTSEFEMPVMQDLSFNAANLGLRTLRRDHPMTLSVAVLENADKYKLYYELSDGSIFSNEVYAKGLRRVQLKLAAYNDAKIFISMIRDNRESNLEFLSHVEKFLSSS